MAKYKDALEKAIEYFNGDELAAQVFLGKYALTTPEGDILESTPRQMHERLAKEFARIEAKYPNPLSYEDILKYFESWEIVPQGSPMSAVGNPYQLASLSNCFVAGTKVHTSKGIKNIEDVAIGDEVVTHMGRVRPVVQVHKNKLNNRKLYNLKCYRTPNVVVTENHKFFSISREQLKWKQSPGWNSVEYLRAGDYIQIPNNKELGKAIDFDISSLFGETFEYGDKKYLVERTPEKIRLTTVGKNGAKRPHDHFVPSIIHANEEFAYFLGLWYGDGCVFGENTKLNSPSKRNKTTKKCTSVRGITFTFGSHETNLSLFVQTYLNSLGIAFDLNNNDHLDGTTQIVVHSPILGYAFEKLFGRRFDGKKLNHSIHSWTKNMVEALLRGIVDSDGTITKAGDVRVVLSNKNLVKELYHLFRSRNILVGYSETASSARLDFGRNDRLRTESRKSYVDDRITAVLSNKTNHCITIDGNTYVEILDKSIADVAPEYVYTFGVEEDHSYSVEGIIAMNCFVIQPPEDSYGGIFRADQELAQIMKRRGGCMEESTNVVTEDKGLQKLSEIKVGQKILSYDTNTKKSEYKTVLDKFETEVLPENRIVIKTKNGIEVKTSKLHPILTMNVETGEYFYKQAGEIVPGDCLIQPEASENFKKLDKDSEEAKLGWFIGAHMGDGTAGKVKARYKTTKRSWTVDRVRVRMLGDNEAVVKRYGSIANSLLSSKGLDCHTSTRSEYRTPVWEYGNSNKGVQNLVKTYFDNQVGKKTYSGRTPSYIKNNHLWPSYIAGLVDTDGTIRQEGTITISICAKNIIDDVSSWLSSVGVRAHTRVYVPKRANEQPIYKLSICDHSHPAVSEIMKHVVHEKKSAKFKECRGRDYSATYLLSNVEQTNILQKYNDGKYRSKYSNNLSACIKNLKKSTVGAGMGSLKIFETFKLLSKEKIAEIKQRTTVVDVSTDLVSEKYYDIVVEKNNNYYAGNFGLVVDHNCGLDISKIRPKGIATSNAAKTTDGIGVFMERFSNTCREVAQNGRRGAEMITISVHHPEIETFINIKRDLKKVTGANISIRLSDEFMNAVKSNGDVELRWPVDSAKPKIKTTVNAKKIWDQIVDSAWASAEPGLLFWDTALRETPAHAYPEFVSVSTNPCAELLLSPYDSCRLLLINALKFVKNKFQQDSSFDFKSFYESTRIGQRLMDDLVDLELECVDKIIAKIDNDPEDEEVKRVEKNLWLKIRKACADGRRTGLGITAIGDTIASLGLRYGSKDSIDMVEEIYKTHARAAYTETVNLAKERGTFPVYNYDLEKEHPFIKKVMNLDSELLENWKKYGRRNIALTTTAPAGSVSVLTQTTSGIEPAFMVSYKRRKKINPNDITAKVDFVDELGDKWQEHTVYHHQFKNWMETTGKTAVEDSPYYKSMSNDVDWAASVDLQAAAQRWCCHAISKTCNIPNSASRELVGEIYLNAWEKGCKGFTVYRDGCRSGVLVSDEPKEKKEEKTTGSTNQRRRSADKVQDRHAPKRPKELPCDVHAMTVGGEKWTFFIGTLEGRPYEIIGGLSKFVSIPKRVKTGKLVKHNGPENPVARYDFHFDFEKGPDEETIIKDVTNCFENATYGAFTRTISLALRHGTPLQYVVEQLTKGSEKEDDLFSFSKAATRVLKQYIADGTKVSGDKKCKECGSNGLVFQEGCLLCTQCGSSKCG